MQIAVVVVRTQICPSSVELFVFTFVQKYVAGSRRLFGSGQILPEVKRGELSSVAVVVSEDPSREKDIGREILPLLPPG